MIDNQLTMYGHLRVSCSKVWAHCSSAVYALPGSFW